MYGLAFAALLAASAINNERRSRRILAVLSKGITRGEYLAGLLAGVMMAVAIFCAVLFAVAFACVRDTASVTAFVLVVLVLCFRTATLALVFSTFLHPLMATATAAVVLACESLAARALGGAWFSALPSWLLVDRASNFGSQDWTMPVAACAWAVLHAALFWAIATAIFARRDIAVAVE